MMAQILFVDDDPLTLEMLTRAVQLFGHEAVLAASAQEALILTGQRTPDLIFVDGSLPDMDGLSLLRCLRDQPATAHVPVLMLSAGPELDAAGLAKAAGAQAYLSKPIRLQTLLDVIQEYTAK
jgi:CheY-like chemotaxis protein